MTRRAAIAARPLFCKLPLDIPFEREYIDCTNCTNRSSARIHHGGELMAFSFGFLIAAALLIIILFAAFLLRR